MSKHGHQDRNSSGSAAGGSTRPASAPAKIVFRGADGNIEPELFRKTAEEWAEHVYSQSGRDSNKYTQLYRFYDQVLRIHEDVRGDEERFKQSRAHLNMIYAHAAYAQGRKLVSKEFLDMLAQCLDQTNKPADLEIFANYFEAFMGFTKLRNPK